MPESTHTQPPALWLTLDDVVEVLRLTIFSSYFCLLGNFIIGRVTVLLPQTWRDQLVDYHLPTIWYVWLRVVCGFEVLRHLDRVYKYGPKRAFWPTRLKWEEQIVLVTGGVGGGLGQVLCDRIAEKGARVVSVNLEQPQAEQHERIRCYVCDVGDAPAVRAMAERVKREAGTPTIIINNAGVVKGKLLLDLTDEDIHSTFNANLLGAFHILRAFLPDIIRAGSGHIVNVSSVLGLISTVQMSDYCAAKAGLIALHHTLRRELSGSHSAPEIQTTLVLPAWVRTPLFARIRFPQNILFRFLAPPLEPEAVVRGIMGALEAQEGRTLRLPRYTHVGRVLHEGAGLVPEWMRGVADWVSGQDEAMRGYGPSPDAAERLRMGRRRGKGKKVD